MLGMAGAYLLRAVAESGSFSKLAVVALAIAYAGMWRVWAVRVPARAWFASTTYAATSALILAPMLWELTLRFHFLTSAAAAAVLAAFVLAAYTLAWKRNLTAVVWVAALTSALAAIALLVATHNVVPFVCVLLLTAAVTETASSRNRWLSVRPIAAIAADIAVWPADDLADLPDPVDGLVLGPDRRVRHLLVAGEEVVIDGNLIGVDIRQAHAELAQRARRLWT